MLKTLLALLDGPAQTEQLQDDDARTALTALLIRVAKEDGHYAPSERVVIHDLIGERYSLDPAQTDALMEEAEAFEAQAGDTVRITRLIKDGVPYINRVEVVEALWQVVLADDERSDEENAFLRLVVSLIGVTDQESGLARQRVATAADGTKPIR